MKPQRRQALQMLAATLLGALPFSSRSQAFPSRPVTIVLPYPPGASTDQVARLVQPKLSAAFGHNVIVEYKPGANGSLGAAYVAKSPPDGYRILLATQPIVAISPHLQKNMGFDPFKELTPLTNGVNAVVALCVHASLGVNTLPELVAYSKKNPGKLAFGTAGAGSPQHVGGVLLAQRAQIDMIHAPYKGGGPMVNDLLAGHIKVGIATLSVFKPLMSDGRLRVIAIGEKTRFPGTPDIPTVAETLPGFELSTWLGFFGPGGLPADVAAFLSNEIAKALRAEDVRSKLEEAALLVSAEGPEALAKTVRADYEFYGRLIREHRISID